MKNTSLFHDTSLAMLGALAAIVVERAYKSRWIDLVMVIVAFAAGIYLGEAVEDLEDD